MLLETYEIDRVPSSGAKDADAPGIGALLGGVGELLEELIGAEACVVAPTRAGRLRRDPKGDLSLQFLRRLPAPARCRKDTPRAWRRKSPLGTS